MDDLQAVILLSTGRTGTMFFARLFQTYFPRQADSYHEAGERSRLINIFSNAHLAGLAPRWLPLWAWERAVRPALRRCAKPFYIDSNNQLYALVPRNPGLYPNLKVIHIVRDPRDYVRSHINWARHRPKSFIANHLIPFWQPNAALLNEMSWADWLRASPLERFAWIWDFKNRLIASLAGGQVPYLRVKFEDFFGHPRPENAINRMMRFIGLPELEDVSGAFARRVNPNQGQSFPAWQAWSPRQCRQLQRICGATMQAYGYGDEPEWRRKLASTAADPQGAEQL